MKKPERTKKTSTPTKPPDSRDTPAWNSTTRRIATPRSPSISGLNCGRSTAMTDLRNELRRSYGASRPPARTSGRQPSHDSQAHAEHQPLEQHHRNQRVQRQIHQLWRDLLIHRMHPRPAPYPLPDIPQAEGGHDGHSRPDHSQKAKSRRRQAARRPDHPLSTFSALPRLGRDVPAAEGASLHRGGQRLSRTACDGNRG